MALPNVMSQPKEEQTLLAFYKISKKEKADMLLYTSFLFLNEFMIKLFSQYHTFGGNFFAIYYQRINIHTCL